MFFKRNKTQTDSDHFGQVKEEAFYFNDIRTYFDKKDKKDYAQVISDSTANDLDFEELFIYLDRTNSKVGQQFLYKQLRCLPHENETLPEKELLIQKIMDDPSLQKSTAKVLNQLNAKEADNICNLFQDAHLQKPKWFPLTRLMTALSVLSLLAIFYYPQAFFISLLIFIINMGFHYWNKRNLLQYSSSIGQLMVMLKVAEKLKQEDSFHAFSKDINPALKVLKKIKGNMSYFQLDIKLEADTTMIFWGILELTKIYFLLEPLLLFSSLVKLDSKRREIEEIYQFIGQVDSLYSIASLRAGTKTYCIPSYENELALKAKGLYHPLLNNPVTNSLSLTEKSMLLTGSNMSGKTSFIRTVAINCLTAQTINTCFAEELELPKMKIHSAIRISDDLLNDKSYYFEEVLRIKEMIAISKQDTPCLFLLDELYKGTNTVERIAAAEAVLHYLAQHNNLVFVATHDIELADLLQEKYELYHFSESIEGEKVAFDYKLKPGTITETNAIRILAINHYPQEIIDRALNHLKKNL